MATQHAVPAQVISLNSWGDDRTRALVKTKEFEAMVVRLVSGKVLPPHKANGPITVQCLSGNVTFSANGSDHPMAAGDWLYLEGNTEHSVTAHEDSALLVTVVLAH